ncbi:Retrovirus-related Pol polyprotein from transposon TNT 1-94, partial [Trichinella patagoniensis]
LQVDKLESAIAIGKKVAPAVSNAESLKKHEEALKTFEKEDILAQLILVSSMNAANVDLTATSKFALEIWQKLTAVYEQSSGPRVDRLMEEFFKCAKWQDMSPEYFEFKTVWESVPVGERSVNLLIECLRLIEMRLPEKTTDSCHQIGHLAKNCTMTAVKNAGQSRQSLGGLNLFSIGKAAEKGFNFTAFRKNGRVKLSGIRSLNGIYKLHVRVCIPEKPAYVHLNAVDASLQLWHERLCHQNKRHVQQVQNNHGIKVYAQEEFCTGCVYGKHHRESFHSRKYGPRAPGKLIHADLRGPMHVTSLGGS